MPHIPGAKRKAKAWQSRSTTNDSFYQSPQWRNLRLDYIIRNPLCVHCESKGLIVPANVVDHIIPINQGGARLSLDNLQSLCTRCHNAKSATEKKMYIKDE